MQMIWPGRTKMVISQLSRHNCYETSQNNSSPDLLDGLIIFYINCDRGRKRKLEIDKFHLYFFNLERFKSPSIILKSILDNIKNLPEQSVSTF